MANRLLITLAVPVLLGALFVATPSGNGLRDELLSGLSFGSHEVIDCTKIPVSEMRGVVFADPVLSKRENGETFRPDGNYVMDSMKIIKSRDMNLVRVPIYWEAYANNSAAFLAEVDTVTRAAADNEICVIFDNHHWYTTSTWGIKKIGDAEGKGFPSFVMTGFPVIESEDTYQSTGAPFWSAFLRNDIAIGGRQIWDVQLEFLAKVISRVDHFPNVVGYEILNEPHIFNASQYDDLGRYHTYMAQEIREMTDKRIFFDRETARGFTRIPSMEYKIVPQNVTGIVYAPHLYSAPYPDTQAEEQIINFKKWSQEWNVEVLVGEWSARTQQDTDVFVKTMDENDFGWTYYSWRPIESRGLGVSLYDSDSTLPTEGLRQLSSAIDRISGSD